MSDICINAAPAAHFTNAAYEGSWFEIAKYQTAGGAFFERSCVCTRVDVAALSAPSADLSAHFSCRDKVPSGKFLNATGRLYDEDPPGKWMQKLMMFVPPVSYTIVARTLSCSEVNCCPSSPCLHHQCRDTIPLATKPMWYSSCVVVFTQQHHDRL
jgi:hypothetical protein